MGDNINRCTLCSRPKDDKRGGPCCICIADAKREQESELAQRGPDSHHAVMNEAYAVGMEHGDRFGAW